MDLRKLTYFATVAECLSFTRAAQKLNVAQPALSRQVKLLEESLGLELLLRNGRHVTLTDAGAVLLEHARELIYGFEKVEYEMQARRERPKGRVIVGVPPSLGPIVVPQVVERVLKEFPQVVIRVREATSVILEGWLRESELDIALIGAQPRHNDIKIKKVATEEIGLISRKDLMTTERKPEILCQTLPLILTGQTSSLIRPTLYCEGVELPVSIEIDALQVIKEILLRGHGVTVLPVGYFRSEIARGDIAAARFEGIRLSRPIFLGKTCSKTTSQAVEAVSSIIETEMRRLVSRNVLSLGDSSAPHGEPIFSAKMGLAEVGP